MKEQSNGVKLSAAVVSDRGLSKKRPLNEDSFLSDPERSIFAVADGVGGAQAGEVASQTAMEVLDEAFRHIEPGADVEDLLEIAIQRANSSIHRMSREHPKLSMMATTVVALHLDGRVATIGHVGDSRLYRLAPDGKLHRETADHSVVEEEVRAGRMTPEQASNHPSRNVISRALGAEETVEVDLKTMEIEDGTSFLLCSDGITRHIPDPEIRELLASGRDLKAICEEMKRLCYERGAEDNLTAVIVRIGEAVQFAALEDERTLISTRPQLAATMSGDFSAASQAGLGAATLESELHDTVDAPAKIPTVQASPAPPPSTQPVVPHAALPASMPPPRSAFKSLLRAITFLLLLGIVGAAAFFGGTYYQKQKSEAALPLTNPAPTGTPAAQPNQASAFEQERARVDKDPRDWIERVAQARATREGKPLAEVDDSEFLYLYGRASLLTGNYQEADKALKNALTKLKDGNPLKVDVRMAGVVAASGLSKNFSTRTVQDALREMENVSTKQNSMVPGKPPEGAESQPLTTPTPTP
jgi:serine/threonine protein phosphatase PrpC